MGGIWHTLWIFKSDGNDLELKLRKNNLHRGSVSEVAHDFRTCGLILSPPAAFCEPNFTSISNTSLAFILIEESFKIRGLNFLIGGKLKLFFVKVELKYWFKI